MDNISILDCTLRDGGYINNWEFSSKIGNRIFNALKDSEVDLIECGYLSNKDNQTESTLFTNIKELQNYFIKHTNNMLVMINHGDFEVNTLPDKSETYIQGIRLAFHKKNLDTALKEAEMIKAKGYKLFFQPMVTKSYTDEEFLALLHIANKLKPHSFYIVDSFGSLDKRDFIRYLSIADHILNSTISLGFHGHNNMQFVFANAINMIENTSSRNIIIDSSVFGMGRGAGNLNSEIIMDYLNKHYKKTYMIEPLLEIMDDYLETLYKKNPWGFTPTQYLSAKHNCHPNYASYLTNKKRLSISGIDQILSQIDSTKKLSYSIDYIEELYLTYNKNIQLNNTLNPSLFQDKEILLLGAGPSILKEKEKIQNIIQTEHLFVIALNSLGEEFRTDLQFFSNQKRYDEYVTSIDANKLLVTSNIILHKQHKNAPIISYEILLKNAQTFFDNILTLTFSLLNTYTVKKVYLAGVDGYQLNAKNYAHEELSINDAPYMEDENKKLYALIEEYSKHLNLAFVTESIFKKAIALKILGVIPARYQSSRFEGKPLCIIKNIPMIKRTYDQAKKSELLTELIVATDNEKIKSYCQSQNIPVVMTSPNCLTGTDRLAEVAKQLHYDLYVNIQGDEPVIDPHSIDEVVSEYQKYGEEYIAYNLYKIIADTSEIEADTIIKTIVNEKDELMYMSRLSIPFNKSNQAVSHKKQVCVYGFTKQALEVFSSRDKTLNEKFEDIEILRFIDMGYKVKMKETTVNSIAVDVPEDIIKVEIFLNDNGLI